MAMPPSQEYYPSNQPSGIGQAPYVAPPPLLEPDPPRIYPQQSQNQYQPEQFQQQQSPPSPQQLFENQQATSDQIYDAGSANSDGDSFVLRSPDPFYFKLFKSIGNRYQLLLDSSTPHWVARWIFSLVILLIFMIRILVAQGFLSPKIDPAFQFQEDGDDDLGPPLLPTGGKDEFRPFIRRLPEFKFWLSATKATLLSLFLTLFEVFDMPVFWPILLIYFIILFISTMRQQIKHMIKYGYVPWDKGKVKYGRQVDDPTSLYPTTI